MPPAIDELMRAAVPLFVSVPLLRYTPLLLPVMVPRLTTVPVPKIATPLLLAEIWAALLFVTVPLPIRCTASPSVPVTVTVPWLVIVAAVVPSLSTWIPYFPPEITAAVPLLLTVPPLAPRKTPKSDVPVIVPWLLTVPTPPLIATPSIPPAMRAAVPLLVTAPPAFRLTPRLAVPAIVPWFTTEPAALSMTTPYCPPAMLAAVPLLLTVPPAWRNTPLSDVAKIVP